MARRLGGLSRYDKATAATDGAGGWCMRFREEEEEGAGEEGRGAQRLSEDMLLCVKCRVASETRTISSSSSARCVLTHGVGREGWRGECGSEVQ